MNMCEPHEGLKIYYENSSKGAYQINDDGTCTNIEQRKHMGAVLKMTREEAIKAVRSSGTVYDGQVEPTVKMFEALGLLKFDAARDHIKVEEEKKVKWNEKPIVEKLWFQHDTFIADLALHGYKIVPK